MIQPFTLAQLSACVHHSAPVLEGHVVPQLNPSKVDLKSCQDDILVSWRKT